VKQKSKNSIYSTFPEDTLPVRNNWFRKRRKLFKETRRQALFVKKSSLSFLEMFYFKGY
jgi:hypothetical protein